MNFTHQHYMQLFAFVKVLWYIHIYIYKALFNQLAATKYLIVIHKLLSTYLLVCMYVSLLA